MRGVTDSQVEFEHNCLSLRTAAAEMEAVAAQNARSKNPVYHFILSWPADEKPTDDEIFASGRYAIEALNMANHQYLSAIHRDTDHVHLHVAVNRIHPESFRAVYPDRDYFKLGRAARELELRYGWKHTAGPFAVFDRDGEKVVDWASADKSSSGKVPSRAAQMEIHRSEESLFSYARSTPRTELLQMMGEDLDFSWPTLHQVLARHGLELRPKGQGFAIYDAYDPTVTPIKASDVHESLSRTRLERRLGSYAPPMLPPAPSDEQPGYSRFREPRRNAQMREDRRLARAQARRALRDAYARYRAEFVYRRPDADAYRRAVAALRAGAREKRHSIRHGTMSPIARKALYSVVAFELARDLEQLRVDAAKERNALRQDPGNKRLSYEAWVNQAAAGGDAAALSQLRAWSYREQRTAKNKELIDGFSGQRGHAEHRVRELEGFSRMVLPTGATKYVFSAGRGDFTDLGDSMEIDGPGHLVKEAALLTALRLAKDKYDGKFAINGSDQFVQRCVELLVHHKIDVALMDPKQAEMVRNALASLPKNRRSTPGR